MSRYSLIRPRRSRSVWGRPAADTRLLPNTFPTRRWKVHRLHAAHPSLGSLPRLRLLLGVLTPGHTPGGRPDTLGSPVAIAPRLDSPVAYLGTPLSHGDGMEDTPDPLRTVESVWGSYPFQDSPVLPLGDPCSPGDGREFALPSLRMVERLPHTDRPQRDTPSSPADLRVWRSLAPRPLHLGHGPSIAYTPPPFSILPDPRCGAAHPEATRRVERGVAHVSHRLTLPANSLPVLPDSDRESIPFTPSFPTPSRNPSLPTPSLPPPSQNPSLPTPSLPPPPESIPSTRHSRPRSGIHPRGGVWGRQVPVGATGGSPSPVRNTRQGGMGE